MAWGAASILAALRFEIGVREVVLLTGVETGAVELAIDQVVHELLDGAQMHLPFEIDRN